MKNEFKKDIRNTRDKVVLADVQRVAGILGKDTLSIQEYNEYGRYSSDAIRHRFGSWSKIVVTAGLQRSRITGITDLELFENLAEVWEKLGRQPAYASMRKPLSKFVAGTYVDHFGSWREALVAFELHKKGEG
jgi:hypothetical protein